MQSQLERATHRSWCNYTLCLFPAHIPFCPNSLLFGNQAMLVTSYSTHAPVNLWCEHVLFWGNDMEAKTTRGYRLSLQTVWLQSPVSNLNLLCHLKSPWTNLTLACNNRLEECLSVLCVWPQAYLLWSWHWKIMTHTHTHTLSNPQTQEINQNYMQHHGLLTAEHVTQTHEHWDKTSLRHLHLFFKLSLKQHSKCVSL